jgi:hypothetical protein
VLQRACVAWIPNSSQNIARSQPTKEACNRSVVLGLRNGRHSTYCSRSVTQCVGRYAAQPPSLQDVDADKGYSRSKSVKKIKDRSIATEGHRHVFMKAELLNQRKSLTCSHPYIAPFIKTSHRSNTERGQAEQISCNFYLMQEATTTFLPALTSRTKSRNTTVANTIPVLCLLFKERSNIATSTCMELRHTDQRLAAPSINITQKQDKGMQIEKTHQKTHPTHKQEFSISAARLQVESCDQRSIL